MALGGGPAGETVLGGEGGQIGPLQLAPLHRQGGDHLVVGQRHVAGAGGLGDVGVLHLGGVLVDVGDLQAVLVQRSGHQAGDDGLGSGAGANGVAAQHVQVDLGADAVVLGQHHGEASHHVLQDGQALLHVVLAVHAQLGGAAAGGDHHGLVGPGGHQGGGLDHGVGGGGAEAPGVGAGGVDQAGDLSGALGEVAAAPLVHVAAGLLGAVHHVLNILLGDAGVVDGGEQGHDGAGLGDDVLVHDVGGQVHVDVVGPVDAAHQSALVIQALGVLLSHQTGDLGGLGLGLGDAGHDGLVDDGVGGQLGAVGVHKALLQLHQAEHVAGLHQQQELLLGHDLAELAVPVGHVAGLVAPGLGHLSQLVGVLVADVDLVGPIAEDLVEGADMAGQLLEVLAVGVDDALGGLGGPVVEDHVGGVHQNVSGALDHTFHIVHSLSLCCFRPGQGRSIAINRCSSAPAAGVCARPMARGPRGRSCSHL